MLVAIVGSREWAEPRRVEAFVVNLARKYPDAVIVSGGARGVDSVAETTALQVELSYVSYRPIQVGARFEVDRIQVGLDGVTRTRLNGSYASFGQAAYARNREIVSDADQVVAFTTGSRGTQLSLDLAAQLGTPTHVYRPARG